MSTRRGRASPTDLAQPALFGTSLYDDPAAELHEGASARLREHPALPGCSILRRSSPGVRRERLPGSRWRPRGGAVESQRATGLSGHCAADQLPTMRSVVNDSGGVLRRRRSADYGASVGYPEPAFLTPGAAGPAPMIGGRLETCGGPGVRRRACTQLDRGRGVVRRVRGSDRRGGYVLLPDGAGFSLPA